MTRIRTKRLLQAAILVGGLVPVGAGLAGVILGPAMTAHAGISFAVPIPLDSHYRYLSGLLLGIGLGFWSTIPNVELKRERFCLLTLIVVIGGFGRLTSLAEIGRPDTPMQLAFGMELLITPLLAVWQFCVSRQRPV